MSVYAEALTDQFPGHSDIPFFGDFFAFYQDVDKLVQQRYQKYGSVFMWKPFTPGVCLLGGEANQQVLVTEQKKFSAGQAWERRIGKLFRGGLLLRDGADHRKFRLLMQVAFRKDALDSYLSRSKSLIQQHVHSWPLAPRDVYILGKELTLDNAIRIFFGIEDRANLVNYNMHITNLVGGSITLLQSSTFNPKFHRAMASRKELCRLLQPLLEKTRKNPGNDMLSHLCLAKDEDEHQLSDEEIIDQMIFIMMAAHDTTASSISSLFYELARNPSWQAKLAEESLQLEQEQIPIEQLPQRLKSLQLVIKETLRRHTPLKVIGRIAVEDFVYQGYKIPAGTGVTLIPSFSHQMKEYWQEPDRFDPERFARGEPFHPYAYVPFGGGLHTCLGQQFAEKFLAVIMHYILVQRSWTIPELDHCRFQKVPIQVPKKPLKIMFQLR